LLDELFQQRTEPKARLAPGCPEVHNHRLQSRTLHHLFVKVLFRDIENPARSARAHSGLSLLHQAAPSQARGRILMIRAGRFPGTRGAPPGSAVGNALPGILDRIIEESPQQLLLERLPDRRLISAAIDAHEQSPAVAVLAQAEAYLFREGVAEALTD